MNAEVEVPKVVARLSESKKQLVTDPCPYCKKTHYHGAGDDPLNPAYGYRKSHCADLSYKGIILVPPPAESGF
jgi:hypothetical protein